MATDVNAQATKISQIAEGILGMVFDPIVPLVADGVRQPAVRAVLREGMMLTERLQEATAELGEAFEDISEEAKAKLAEQRRGESDVATAILTMSSELNERMSQATGGMVDLRTIVPLGIGALALRQLIVKGVQLDDIPWYTLAWYAFDSFAKLNYGYLEHDRHDPPALPSAELRRQYSHEDNLTFEKM